MKKMLVIGLFGLLILGGCGESSKNEAEVVKDTATENKKEETKKSKSNEMFKDNILTADDAIVEYQGAEKTTDIEGKPMMFLFFKMTNNTGESKDVQMMLYDYVSFKQNLGDTTADLMFAMPDYENNPYQEKMDLLNQSINDGGTVELAYPASFEEGLPVQLEFKNGTFGDKVGTIEVE